MIKKVQGLLLTASLGLNPVLLDSYQLVINGEKGDTDRGDGEHTAEYEAGFVTRPFVI